MKKKTVYQSDDEVEIFSTEDECLAYEARLAAAPRIAEWVEGLGTGGKRVTEYIRVITQWESERSVTLGETDSHQNVVNISA